MTRFLSRIVHASTSAARTGIVLALALTLPRCGSDDPPGLPSAANVRGVVFVVFDTLRADHVGAYGSPEGLTPNLDALAARSFVFESAAATSSWTRPSVASMLTSRYPTALGIHDGDDTLDGEAFPTLPSVLRALGGFRTLGTATNGNTSADFGFGHGFDAYELPNLKRSYLDDFEIPIASGVTQKALELLDRSRGEAPFFLFVHYVDPHDPYLPHPGLLPDAEPSGKFDGSRRELSSLDRIPVTENGNEDRARIRYLYAGEVKYADRHFGEFLKGLERRGLAGDLLIVATADHGEGLWDHGIRFHGVDLYEETVRVPLIVHIPNTAQAEAKRIEAPVSLVDLAPTILGVLGIPAPQTFQGKDLTPLLAGRSLVGGVEPRYAEMDRGGRSFESIRMGAMKLIRKRESRTAGDGAVGVPERQIFDLERDPREMDNLAGRETRDEAQLEKAMEEWSASLSSEAPRSEKLPSSGMDRATIESLKALGYLDASEEPDADPSDAAPSVLDFEAADVNVRGVLKGARLPDEGRPWIAEGANASVVLQRVATQTRWAVRAVIDSSILSEGGVRVVVGVEGSPESRFDIDEAGVYSLEGELPPAATPDAPLRVDIRCERDSTAAAGRSDPERACLSLSSIGFH